MNEPESSWSADDVARGLLAWYRAAGVEDAVGEVAVDWLARPEQGPGAGFRLADGIGSAAGSSQAGQTAAGHAEPVRGGGQRPAASTSTRANPDGAPGAPSPPSQPSANARQFPTASPDEAVLAARSAARDAADLEALRAKLEGFNGCALKATAKNLCFYRGAARARLMIIGEAPGRDEDLNGVPFVGPAGKLLDVMLASIGLSEADVHITNTVYWRPPGNRTPSPQETLTCRPFLDRQIELVDPSIIALLGGAAANNVLGMTGELRGSEARGATSRSAPRATRRSRASTRHFCFVRQPTSDKHGEIR